ncbi:HFL034Cp [Eremothecium sinecaudum]|uniref:HFL034Cp n=1 Tax=Eremothecium sinecaudum TaxID=45286 RepID=A0A0X8HUR6_9SACH|nr:HFL034Cp [Eremothecium sinecaudum]AMD21822.1 HFL034Cp [Eremothecium sinecaudum]
MSVCLVITKSVATATLGIYTGMVVTRNLLQTEEESTNKENNCLYSLTSKALATVSTVFFGMSYFKAPQQWKHPYLLYCFLGIPLTLILGSFGRGALSCDSCNKVRKYVGSLRRVVADGSSLDSGELSNETSMSEDHDDIISEDSIVDLGDDASAKTEIVSKGFAGYAAAAAAIVVFTANVVGCIGETL